MTDTATEYDTRHAIALLRHAWDMPHARETRWYAHREFTRVADTAEDQATAYGTQNPLWDIVRWLPAARAYSGVGRLRPEITPFGAFAQATAQQLHDAGLGRGELCGRYSWSIPTPGDITWMVDVLDGRPVVEIGAGSGYWAWQLEQAGADVTAYDPIPPGPDNRYCKHGPYTTVHRGRADAVADHPDAVLLMVWPPYDGDHAAQALRKFGGDTLIYAGEGAYGCTADDDFFDLLGREWTEAGESEQHVTWSGIHCWLRTYTRA